MNEQLRMLNENEIKVPRVFSFRNGLKQQIFVNENLRDLEFTMRDRKLALDYDHCLLVLNELGRFHASSLLYQKSLNKSIYHYFKEEFEASIDSSIFN